MTANLIFALAGFCFGVTAALCVAFLASYALRLRRELKAAQKALEAREITLAEREPRQMGTCPECRSPLTRAFTGETCCIVCGYGVPEQYRKPPKEEPRFSGIGPTDIANREMYERQQETKASTPVFASPSVLNPSLGDIQEAAREATNGGKPK